MSEKYTLLCSDGSLQGGYIAGAIIALYEHFPDQFEQIDLFTASSASVGNLLTYLSYGEKNGGEALWTEEFSTPDFVKFTRLFQGKPIVDIDYLIEDIIRRKYPLQKYYIVNNRVSIEFPAYDVDRDEIVTFTTMKGKLSSGNVIALADTDPHIALKAAMAVPILYDRTVSIFGRRLIDAGMILPIFARDEHIKSRRVITIANRRRMSLLKQIGYSAAALLRYILNIIVSRGLPWRTYFHIMNKGYQYTQAFGHVERNSDRSLTITPSRKLNGSIDNSKQALRENFNLGYDDIVSRKNEIERFFI